MLLWKTSVVLAVALGSVVGFAPPARTTVARRGRASFANEQLSSSWGTALYSSSKNPNREERTIEDAAVVKKGGLDENVRSKLVAESIAPWRTVRLFLYFALGSGAFIGGLVTLSGVVAGLGGARADLDMNTEYMNLAIDFGAATAFGVFAKLDTDKGAELSDNVEKKIQRKKEQKAAAKQMREREKALFELELSVQVGADGKKTNAQIKSLQKGAKQHMIVVIGNKKACRDALVGANLNKMDFAMNNVLVVPYQTDMTEAERQMKPSAGFGDAPKYETAPYVARPVGDGWEDYVQAELDDAVAQGGEKVRDEGIAIVVANNGKVIRRGVGKVPWRMIVEQLDDEVRKIAKDDDGFDFDMPFLSD